MNAVSLSLGLGVGCVSAIRAFRKNCCRKSCGNVNGLMLIAVPTCVTVESGRTERLGTLHL